MNRMNVIRHLFYILVRILERFQLRETFSDDDNENDSMTYALHSYHFWQFQSKLQVQSL